MKKLLTLILLLFVSYCKKKDSVNLVLYEPFPENLSDWNLFIGKLSDLKPNKGVIPYELNISLFTDYANKNRFIWMPEGKSAMYKADDTLEFPIGTIISKTFSYNGANINYPNFKNKLIETRLLINTMTGWKSLPYIWNEEMTDASLEIAGGKKELIFTDKDNRKHNIHYVIPNVNQCKGCHEIDKKLQPIGPKAKNLNRNFMYEEGEKNQLQKLKDVGYLYFLPDLKEISSYPEFSSHTKENLNILARGYLDVNCGHCHNPKGAANTSGLMLNYSETDKTKLGFCKTPVAAGKGSGNLKYDIVPGKPTESILFYRMNSETPDIMMPELGRSIIHKEGVDLIRKWIESQKGNCI